MTLSLVLASGIARSAVEPARITTADIMSPAPANATGASVVTDSEGTAWLTWVERTGDLTALRCAIFVPAEKKWSAANTIARGRDWFINSADLPSLAVGPNGRATVAWSATSSRSAAPSSALHEHASARHALVSRTSDGGKTWSAAVPLTRESDAVEFTCLTTLADGRVLATWIDGRGLKSGGHTRQLFARIVDDSSPDTLINAAVCECCPTSLTAFPDGSALLAYRGRTDADVRDMHVMRFRANTWSESRLVHDDHWKTVACPLDGPQLASDGGRVAVAWFTAADDNPRVLASFSSDAGSRFLLPVQINTAKPNGKVGTLLLHDGAMLVTWVGANGSLWLRRVSPDFAPSEPVQLAGPEKGGVSGFPRMALLRDYIGGKAAAECIVAFMSDANPTVHTVLVSIPEDELLDAEKNCDCPSGVDDFRGYAIRGTILGAASSGDGLRVRTIDVPGVLPEGDHELKVEPAENVRSEKAGRPFLGRIERRNGSWWLFQVRLIVAAPQPN